MARRQIIAAVVVSALLGATAGLLWIAGSGATPSKSQTLFRNRLLADAKTTYAVKRLLTRRGGFVTREIVFSDLTGDGRSDAVVLVDTGGVAGAVALYVFSTDGQPATSELRAVYRSQRLYRGSVRVADAKLTLRTPRFKRGDDVCCPAKIVERSYSWSAAAKTLVRRSTRELAGPS